MKLSYGTMEVGHIFISLVAMSFQEVLVVKDVRFLERKRDESHFAINSNSRGNCHNQFSPSSSAL